MKIKSINIINNPILGNLFLDFRDENGKPVDTIILAGENGCGKSTILNIIYGFSLFDPGNYPCMTYINEVHEFIIEVNNEELTLIKANKHTMGYFNKDIVDNELIIKRMFSGRGWENFTASFVAADTYEQTTINAGAFWDIRGIFKTLFSDASISFTPQNIKTVTAKKLDEINPTSIKSSDNLASEITQLIVDIQALDDAEFAEWGRQNIGERIEPSFLDLRLRRFKNAFNLMFNNLSYHGVTNENNSKKVLFIRNHNMIPIEDLSSGEKQIVFRGGFLLKDKDCNTGAAVLIDEPEISLHPRWQLKILDFYKRLFTNNIGEQTSQIIVATHSPFIIHNDTRSMDKVIVLERKDTGEIEIKENPQYFAWLPEKAIQEAFKITLTTTQRAKVFVEGETDEKYFKQASIALGKYLDYDVCCIGRVNNRGVSEYSGDTYLNHARNFFIANPSSQPVLLLYDCDTNKPNEDFHNLFIRRIPFNPDNPLYKIGSENLLTLPQDFIPEQFHSGVEKVDNYGVPNIKKSLDKTKLCDWICSLPLTEQARCFDKFNIIFSIIDDVLGGIQNISLAE